MTRNALGIITIPKKRSKMRYLEFGRDITPDLTHSNRFRGAEGITIVDYMKPLLPLAPLSVLWNSQALVFIQSVEFYGAMLFSNILQVFSHCTNMKELTFTHIALDEYRRFNADKANGTKATNFCGGKLTTLEFNGTGALSKDELLILDFINGFVELPMLDSILFNMMTYGYHPNNFTNEVMERFGETVPSDVLSCLLVKCCATLQTITIRRHQFIFLQSEPNPETFSCLPNLATVSLKKIRFQYDSLGIHHLLSHQTKLEKLECYANYEESRLLSKQEFQNLIDAIGECVKNSEKTLKHVHLVGISAFPASEPGGSAESDTEMDEEGEKSKQDENTDILTVDFKIYEDCDALTGLWLTKMNCNRNESPNIFSTSFTFINAKFLPASLVQLEIITGHVAPEELTSLSERFHALTNLHYCRVNSLIPFVITRECFSHIVSIQNSWMQILFFNGVLASDFYPQEVLLSYRSPANRRHWELKMSESLCEFVCKETRNRF